MLTRDRLGIRRLSAIGGEDTWYHDPWIMPDADSRALAALLEDTLRKANRDWDLLDLILRPSTSAPFIDALKRLGLPCETQVPWRQHPAIHWEGDWSSYWSERSDSLRRIVARRTKRLNQRPHRFYEASRDEAKPLIEALCRLQAANFDGLRDWDSYHAFMRLIAADLLDHGFGSLHVLEIDGSPAAIQFQSRHADRVYGLLRAYDPAFESYSPGSLLAAWSFERMHQQGVRWIDLGPGENGWKQQVQTTRDETVQVQIGSPASLLALGVIGVTGYVKPQLENHGIARYLNQKIRALRAGRPTPLPIS
jgi:CelD/BcsL family acetyltransferase involved in cellulose biosynthesis